MKKQIIKLGLTALIILMTAVLLCSCGNEKTPYEINDQDGYTVSVKYDANGGIFTTNTSVIVDSYSPDATSEIALIAPDDPQRGNDAFNVINNEHFLAGWYTERTEVSEGVYTYSGKWDFENDLLTVDGTDYTAEEPVMTLYAAWIPLFEIEFYSLDDGECLGTYMYDPMVTEDIYVPAWDEETGAINMYNFPDRSGYTFENVYYDESATEAVTTDVIEHPGVVDYDTGTVTDSNLKLYVEWTEGEWYHIYNAEQFLDNASINGNYEIHADLDFADEIWPTSFMYGNFAGVINGNGHTFKNIEFTQTNNSKVNAGLFGYLTETARINDVKFENVTFTIKAGTRVVGTCYGLFAGTISAEAKINNVSVLASKLQIDSGCYFGVDDYSIGLVCGMGDQSVLTTAEIEYAAVGDAPETVDVVINGYTAVLE